MSQTINNATISLFKEFNDHFTLEQLSQKTKLPRATLYRRIGSKDALLKQLQEQGLIKLNQQTDIKSRIFKATRMIVTKFGFINCTMEQIAKEAGLGVATLYRHFSEKEKLLLAFTLELKTELNVLNPIKSPQKNFVNSLLPMIENILIFIHRNEDLIHLLFFGSPSERKYINRIRDASASTFSSISNFLKHFQEQGEITKKLTIEDMTTALVGLIFQFSITSPQHFNRPLNLTKDAHTITRLFCISLCNSTKEGTK